MSQREASVAKKCRWRLSASLGSDEPPAANESDCQEPLLHQRDYACLRCIGSHVMNVDVTVTTQGEIQADVLRSDTAGSPDLVAVIVDVIAGRGAAIAVDVELGTRRVEGTVDRESPISLHKEIHR